MRASQGLLVLVSGGLLLISNVLPGSLLEYDRSAIARGEWWRLWSGQFCHSSALHLFGILSALAGVAIIAGQAIRRWLALLPVAAPLLSAFLLITAPALEHYRGLSGLVALLVVGAAVDGGIIGRVLGLAYLGKLFFGATTGSPSALLPQGIVTAWPAHLGGILLGLVAALGFRRQASQNTQDPR